ncbi:DNA-directed DNA polymerase [Escherichia phage A7_1]|nr:DNA-directed DNA polymerase [Escherichia phage A7_1]
MELEEGEKMKGLFIGDAEANGLLTEVDLIHCVLFKEYKKDNWNIFLDPQREGYDQAVKFIQSKGKNFKIRTIEELNEWFVTEPKAIAIHNIFGYDLQLFKKMLGTTYDMFADPGCMGTINGKQVNIFDTLSMSRTLYPDRPLPRGCPEMVKNPVTGKMKPVGPHGLEAWGMRVANQKVAIEDWRGLPLWKYCDRIIEDVIINEMVWDALMKEISCESMPDDKRFMFKDETDKDQKKFKMINWKNALRRGMLTDYLMIEQEIQGVSFDEEKALKLRDRIDKMMTDIELEVEPKLPKKEMSKSAQPTFPSKPFKGDGSLSGTGWKWLEKLGYNINWEALEFKGAPSKPFKADGSLTAAAIKYCVEHGVEDESKMGDFIRAQNVKQQGLVPLPPEDMARALMDIKEQKMPDIMIPMRIGNQDDVKKFLIRDAGWVPTLWRTKDATKDQFKKQRPDNEVDIIVRQYIDDLDQTEYRDLILKSLGISGKQWQDKEKMYKFFRKKARALPTSPQLKDQQGLCPNLERVDGEMAKQIVKWLSLRNRRSVLDPLKEEKVDTGWLNHPRLRVDGKLPARYSGITNTGRRKHTIVANVPKPDEKVLLGKEMRELFRASEGKYQVGIDGSNLEGMIAAWGAYDFDGGAYLRIMESGDAHSRNAEAYTKAAGKKVSRGEGKGVTYGIMYGAQAAKIASMLGITLEKAQAVIDAFWDSNIGLKGRKEALEKFWEANGKRFIYGLDGRKIYTRSKHSLLNAYQQNGGAALFDLVGILLHWQLVKKGWYDEGVRRIIYYHDEYQLEVPHKFKKTWTFDNEADAKKFVEACLAKKMVLDGHCVKEGKFKCDPDENGIFTITYCPVGEMVVRCVEQAAKMMKSPVMITGEYLTGMNWGACH